MVGELVVQTPTRDDDYIEYEVPAVWYEPGSDAFYSIYDSWHRRPIDRVNAVKTGLNFGFPILIGLVIIVAHLRLYQLGVRPILSANAEYRRRQELLSRPSVYSMVVLASSVACGFLIHQFARSSVDRDFVAEVIVHDRALNNRYVAGRAPSPDRWTDVASRAPKITYCDDDPQHPACKE